jgi:hypothetical protein
MGYTDSRCPKRRRDLRRRSERGPNRWIFAWNEHGCMDVMYHVPES